MTFHKFLNSKNTFCLQDKKKLLSRWTRVFHVFPLSMDNESMFLTLKKIKKKNYLCIWGYFCTFTWVFCVINRVIEVFWYFSRLLLDFLIREVVGMCSRRASGWVAFAPFWWRMWRHKEGICLRGCGCILFKTQSVAVW